MLSPYDQDLIIKILLAFFFGCIIGFDRQRSHKAAGIRTQMLICVGSALLAGISIHIAEMYAIPGLPRPDPARLMAQIIAGIGFLGAGVIIKGNHRISGVTTAATIWATAAVGIAIGAGFYVPAVITTILVLLLDPLAKFQYNFGLKYSTFMLQVARTQWEIAIKILEHQKIEHKISNTTQTRLNITVYASQEKKKKLVEELNKDKIDFEMFDIED